MILWAGWKWGTLSYWGKQEIQLQRINKVELEYVVDINQANWLEFAMLDGIGEKLGKRIVSYREENGNFRSIKEIQSVKGIGPKTFEKIKKHLLIQEEKQGPL